ncbi:MGMT family protein [Patescibacteria group bacterium]|nr:MGMT family protein [Patescibacteria group bacterium]
MSIFAERVYRIVRQIPRGRRLTYKQVAARAGSPNAYQAVGNILNKNRDFKNIPCHRVVRSDGTPGGYVRGGKMKIALLKKEGYSGGSYSKA